MFFVLLVCFFCFVLFCFVLFFLIMFAHFSDVMNVCLLACLLVCVLLVWWWLLVSFCMLLVCDHLLAHLAGGDRRRVEGT